MLFGAKYSATSGLLSAALLVVFALPAASVQKTRWLSAFQSAFRQLQAGDVSAASNGFELLWKQNSRDAELATSIGGALDSTSHHKDATVWYQRALALDPTFKPALEDFAMNCAVRGKLADAAELLRRKLKQDPEDSKAQYELGLIDLRFKQYLEAASVLGQALDSPNLPAPAERIRLAKATALFHSGRYSQVINIMTSVRESPAEFTLLASGQALSGDLPAAIQTLQAGISAHPREAELYFRLALIFAEGRRVQDARAVLKEGSEQVTGSPLIDYGRALVEEMDGKDDEAIGWAEKTLLINGDQAEVLGLLATLYERQNRTDDAVRTYEKAVKHGASTYTSAKYADLLIRLQRFQEAEKELRAALGRDPEDPDANREMGKLYRATGKSGEAERSLRRSLKSDPAEPQTHYALAQVLRTEGRLKEADFELGLFKSAKTKSESVRILELMPDSN